MRYFFSRKDVVPTRMLLIESGSRSLIEGLLEHFYENWKVPVDLVTCYGGVPKGLREDSVVYRVADYNTSEARRRFLDELRARNYVMAGMICSGEPIMTKWKLMLFFRLPAKFFLINENGDYFWFHRDNAANIRIFVLERLGLTGAGAIRTVLRILLFPLSIVYLLLWAFTAHARRALRLKKA